MKKFVILLILSATVNFSHAREVYNINRGWRFYPDLATVSDNTPVVNLPHVINGPLLGIQTGRGMFNYHKELEIPYSWNGKRLFIKCYGAGPRCHVYVNGKLAGEHIGGYTALCYEITHLVNPGKKNFIRLVVNNSPTLDILPTAGDLFPYGGVFRDVEIIVTGQVAVALTDHGSDGIYVHQRNVSAEKAEGEAIIKVNGIRDQNVEVNFYIEDHQGKKVFEKSSRAKLSGSAISSINIPFTIQNPRLWNGTQDPYMYKCKAEVLTNSTVSDNISVRTGFRYYGFGAGGELMLNGENYALKGVVVHQDRSMSGPALTPDEVIEDISIIEEMGSNAVRTAINAHHPLFYEICDNKGIVVICDFPLAGSSYFTDKQFVNTEIFRTNGIKQAEDVIFQNFNHPSILFWGVFSDMKKRGDDPVDYISHLNMLAKRADPSRKTAATSSEDGEMNFITDLVVWNHFFGWKEGQASDISVWMANYRSKWRKIHSAIGYSAGGHITHQEDSLYRPAHNGSWHPERWQTRVHEDYYRTIHVNQEGFTGILVGNMFDYAAPRGAMSISYGINDHGLVSFDRKVKKDAFYLYKANWNKEEEFVHIAEKRWKVRRQGSQEFKIYSNCEQVELFIDGLSFGIREGHSGIFLWEHIPLELGEHIIEARWENNYDITTIQVQDNKNRHFGE